MSPIFVIILIVNEVNPLELSVEIMERKEECFLKTFVN